MVKETLIKNFVKEEYQDELLDKALKQKERKSALKAEKIAEKQQEKAYRDAEKAEKSANKVHLLSGLKEKFIRKDEELEEGYETFFDAADVSYTAKILESKDILDSNMKKISSLKGVDLLNWNLEKSPIYIGDGKNFLGVSSITRVYPEKEEKGVAYIMLETDYDYIVVSFKKVETF